MRKLNFSNLEILMVQRKNMMSLCNDDNGIILCVGSSLFFYYFFDASLKIKLNMIWHIILYNETYYDWCDKHSRFFMLIFTGYAM